MVREEGPAVQVTSRVDALKRLGAPLERCGFCSTHFVPGDKTYHIICMYEAELSNGYTDYPEMYCSRDCAEAECRRARERTPPGYQYDVFVGDR